MPGRSRQSSEPMKEATVRPERFELPIRIVVVDPVPGLSIALQRGQAAKAELIPPPSQSSEAVVFGIEVTVGPPRRWPAPAAGPCCPGPTQGALLLFLLSGGWHICGPDGVFVGRPDQGPAGRPVLGPDRGAGVGPTPRRANPGPIAERRTRPGISAAPGTGLASGRSKPEQLKEILESAVSAFVSF
jgi:hypothetical protein